MTPTRNTPPRTLTIRHRPVTIATPWVMGILNATPDSFYSGSRCQSSDTVAEKVRQMVDEGADVIDVGACSTRPGAPPVGEDEELARLRMALPIVKREAPQVYLSVDTFRAHVARVAVEELGADIVNDISGGDLDPAMAPVMAQLGVPYVAMHTRGTPETMQQLTHYTHVVNDVLDEMVQKFARLRDAGVTDLIADPGFGFAKTLDQNYELMTHLGIFHRLEAPLLVGVSRKSMVTRVLGITADQALTGTTVLNTVALMQGAHILRVHDVRAAVEARTVCSKLFNQQTTSPISSK